MNPLARTLPWCLLALVLVGCAATGSRPAGDPPASSPPRVRCLSDSAHDTAAGTRPLFFFFCVESP